MDKILKVLKETAQIGLILLTICPPATLIGLFYLLLFIYEYYPNPALQHWARFFFVIGIFWGLAMFWPILIGGTALYLLMKLTEVL